MINIGLTGANGRMGTEITKQIKLNADNYSLTKALTSNADLVSLELKQTAQTIISNINHLNNIDVIIDFSNPELTVTVLHQAIKYCIPIVIGTTGFSDSSQNIIKNYAKTIPIVLSANMSLSVNLMFKLVEIIAGKLPTFETEIIEAHHKYKKDAPSGTAIKIGKVVAATRNLDFATHAKYTRCDNDVIRKPQDIGFSVIRGGNIIGDHEARFIGDDEVLSINSVINNRSSFAKGALIAANFLVNQSPGLYSMLDVLEL